MNDYSYPFYKKISALLVFSGLFFLSLSSLLLFSQNPVEKEGWELTFNDEFNAQQLYRGKWIDHYYWGGRFNKGGLTYYGENQFQLTDSTLKIVAEQKENPEHLPYVSGMIDCNRSFKQQYGYFEIRSKNPSGEGFWPAFWLVTTEKWPPEIDIYEFYTNSPNRLSTTQHWLNKKGYKKMQPKSYIKEDASADFHIYAVEWTEKKISWYYDNQKIRSSRRGTKAMIYPMHIIVNLEISNTKEMDLSKIKLPNALEVDYVRVYKKN